MKKKAGYEKNDILANPAFSGVEAVKKRRICRESAHLLILWHAKTYYPDLPLDYEGVASEFFEAYYGIKYGG
ncbi:MAG: hypothetical protein DSO00_08150 [Archaeoglobi archaeon]|nr:MAG: hypothetical protein DSN99_07625 [Archaeoglobi archaeon]TDA25905.1 MAG: hypothetical protein DSO00_08150 [Archaeoglobi archaeon]